MYTGSSRGNVWCITHCDLDGHAAGAVVKQHYPDANIIITNYNKPIRIDKVGHGDIVFVTDFSLSLEMFQMLERRRCRIIWIDHHETAIANMRQAGWDCEGIRNTEYSGAALTWMYFNVGKSFEHAPYFIKLVNWYDLWQHDKDPNIRPFQYGAGLWDTRPNTFQGSKFWDDLFSNSKGDMLVENIIRHGKVVQNYSVAYHTLLCKDLAYRTRVEFAGLGAREIMAMAIRPGNSSVFEGMNLDGIDATCTAQFITGDVNQYRCSMYSPDGVKEILDIVHAFGGGGHPNAAGFTSKQYPIHTPEYRKPVDLETVVAEYDKLYKMRCASPILLRYANRNNGIGAKVSACRTEISGFKCIAFNHQYIPESLSMLPTNIDCMDPDTGEIAELYVGYVMTNSGYFRCCACPTSTSVDMMKVLDRLQSDNMKNLTEDAYNFKIINGNVWWYSTTVPVKIPAPRSNNPNDTYNLIK